MKLGKSLLLTTTILTAMGMNAVAGDTYVGAQLGGSAAKAGKPTLQNSGSWKGASNTFRKSNQWGVNGGVLLGHRFHECGHMVLDGTVGFNMESTSSKQTVTLSNLTRQSTVKRAYIINFLAKAGHKGFHSKITPYVTAGAALTRYRFDINTGNGAADANASKTTFGWAGGVGLDYALNHKISLGAQYLYTWQPSNHKQILLSRTTYQISSPKGYHATTLGVNVKI